MALGPEEKKKAYLLGGVAGVLGLAGLFLLRGGPGDPGNSSVAPAGNAASSSATAPASTSGSLQIPPSPGGAGDGGGLSGSGAAGTSGGVALASTGTGVGAPQLTAPQGYRPDPFQQFYTKPAPYPTAMPTPRPLPILPPPLAIPAPSANQGEDSAYPLPVLGTGAAGTTSTLLVGLPSARIPRLVNVPTAPRVQVAPPSSGGGSQPALERSSNKRLAGVVIGDSVRALLEVEDVTATTGGSSALGAEGEGGGQTPPKTYIVQPGQEIPEEGIKVLRIERTNENGQTRVRMVVTENGVLRFIELREGAQAAAGRGGAAGYGSGGSGAGTGRYPGAGRYPGGNPGFGGPPPLP